MLFNIPFILPLNLSYFEVITIRVQRARLRKSQESKDRLAQGFVNHSEGVGPNFVIRKFFDH